MRLDYRETFPSGMEQYLSYYGWHFSKKMCDWAVSRMYKTVNGKKEYITPITVEQLDTMLNNAGIALKDLKGYDYLYIANMCKADFYGSSIITEQMLAKYVKDIIEDDDSYEGMVFTRFYADCIGSGTPIPWQEVL